MRVFISWSGPRSHYIALALKQFLERVIQQVKPWVSSDDINAGARWQSCLTDVLATTKVGILCVTPENVTSPWLNFEAGALAKTVDDDTLVCPYLFDITPTDVPQPLAQFQMAQADHDGTFRLVSTINAALGEAALSSDVIQASFEAFWVKLCEALTTVPEPDVCKDHRPNNEVQREILSSVNKVSQQKDSIEYSVKNPCISGGTL
jgi:hypothetical protein